MKDLMLDIETLGTGTRSLITQVGACYFDRYTGEIGDKFCENIIIQDSLDNGFEVRGDTIKFWLEQDKEIIQKMIKNALPVTKVLGHFREFYIKDTIAWAHATFDFPILTNAYHLMKMKQPIPYKLMRDIRTLVDLSGGNKRCICAENQDEVRKNHNALDDCIFQVKYCVEAFNKLKMGMKGEK